MIALGICSSAAYAGASAPADMAAAAPLYEAVGDGAASLPSAVTPDTSATSESPPSSTSGPAKTETVVVPDSEPEPGYVKRGVGMPQTTTEIPQASPSTTPGSSNSDIVNYEGSANPNVDPQLHSLQEFINEDDNTSPLGIEVREARRKLKSGKAVDGLLIVNVTNGSPAAKAGLHADRQKVRDALEVVAVVGAMFFPPAMVAVPILDQVHVGESYDLIIAVDGSRVTNFIDFEDRMRDVQPGEIVYLSILRDGNRVQVPVHVPTVIAPPVF
jgi:hypothetical protein